MPLIIRTVEWVFPAAQAFISLGANLERLEGIEPYSTRLGRPATHLVLRRFKLVGDGGFEPPTSQLSVVRSTPELIPNFKLYVNLSVTISTQKVTLI